MSILFPSLTSTTEEQLMELTKSIRTNAYGEYSVIINIHNDWIRRIWYNNNFDAQTIINAISSYALDGAAVRFFNLTTNLRSFIISAAADNGVSPEVLYPLSAYYIVGNTITLIPSAYSGP